MKEHPDYYIENATIEEVEIELADGMPFNFEEVEVMGNNEGWIAVGFKQAFYITPYKRLPAQRDWAEVIFSKYSDDIQDEVDVHVASEKERVALERGGV